MDIARFAELKPSRLIDVASPRGIIKLTPTRFIRGTDEHDCWLTIEGKSQQAADETEVCTVSFNGIEYPGRFLGVIAKAGFQKLTFQVLITAPEFWRAT